MTMLRSSWKLALIWLLGFAGLTTQLPAFAAATVVGQELVSSSRTGRTTVDYTYRIRVQNGTPALSQVVARVTSTAAATQVLDGEVVVGNIAANTAVVSNDTFKIRQDRTVSFDPRALQWAIDAVEVPPPAAVPDVVGQPQAAAESTIVAAGLIVGTVTTASSATVPAGSVISQAPSAGSSVPASSAVNLEVSSGPALVTVPDVVGQPQAAAEAAIVAAGLTVGTVTTASNATVPAGSVISQVPSSGEAAVSGSAVDLVVSLGRTGAPLNVTIVSPQDQSFVDIDSITIVGEVSDPTSQLTLNGEPIANESGRFSDIVSLSQGLNTIEVSATTDSGEVETATIQVVFDPISGGTVIESVEADIDATDYLLELPNVAKLFFPAGSFQGHAELSALDMPLVSQVATRQEVDLIEAPTLRIKTEVFHSGPLGLEVSIPDLAQIISQGDRVEVAMLLPVGGSEGEPITPELVSLGGSPCESMSALCISLNPGDFLPNNPFDPNDPVVILAAIKLPPQKNWKIWNIPEAQNPIDVTVNSRNAPIPIKFNFHLEPNILLSAPLESMIVTSNYGRAKDGNGVWRKDGHGGIDLKASENTEVRAAHAGVGTGYGNGVYHATGNMINIFGSGRGIATQYLHLSEIDPESVLGIKTCANQTGPSSNQITEQQLIGKSGITAKQDHALPLPEGFIGPAPLTPACLVDFDDVVAAHLHFDLKLDNATKIDPTPFLLTEIGAQGEVDGTKFGMEHFLDAYARKNLSPPYDQPTYFFVKHKDKEIIGSRRDAVIDAKQPVELTFQPGVSKDTKGNIVASDFASGQIDTIDTLSVWAHIPRTGAGNGKEWKLFDFKVQMAKDITGIEISVAGFATPAIISVLAPETDTFTFASSGSPLNTCGGEQGAPLYSTQVFTESNFGNGLRLFPGTGTSGVGLLFNVFGNRRPCSTFLAFRNIGTPQQEVWANVTERRATFSTFNTDREYQLRYYSGDGIKPARCEAGSVNLLSGGQFFASYPVLGCTHKFLTE